MLGSSAVNGVEPLVGLSQDQPESWQYHGVSGDSVVHLPYSSGTTGLPKGVELTSSNWLAVLSTIGYVYLSFMYDIVENRNMKYQSD